MRMNVYRNLVLYDDDDDDEITCSIELLFKKKIVYEFKSENILGTMNE